MEFAQAQNDTFVTPHQLLFVWFNFKAKRVCLHWAKANMKFLFDFYRNSYEHVEFSENQSKSDIAFSQCKCTLRIQKRMRRILTNTGFAPWNTKNSVWYQKCSIVKNNVSFPSTKVGTSAMLFTLISLSTLKHFISYFFYILVSIFCSFF